MKKSAFFGKKKLFEFAPKDDSNCSPMRRNYHIEKQILYYYNIDAIEIVENVEFTQINTYLINLLYRKDYKNVYNLTSEEYFAIQVQ